MRLLPVLGLLALAAFTTAGAASAGGQPYSNCVTPSYPLLFGYGYAVVCLLDDGPIYQGDPVYPGYEATFNNPLYVHSVNSGIASYANVVGRVGQEDYRFDQGDGRSGSGTATLVNGDAAAYSLATGQGTSNDLAQHHDTTQACDASGTCRSTDAHSTTYDSVTFVSVRGGPSAGLGVHESQVNAGDGQGCKENTYVETEQDGQVDRTYLFGPDYACEVEVPQVHDKVSFPDWPDVPL